MLFSGGGTILEPASADHVGSEAVCAELDRVLAFPDMAASGQMSAFLRFVVEEALAGRGEQIKEFTVATRALSRRRDFDPRLDAIVRIVAGKLRRTMQRYYLTAGASDPVRIAIPKGTYCPQFLPQEAAPQAASPDEPPQPPPTPGEQTTVLLVDDHAVLRGGLRMLLDAEADMTVVGEADDGRAAIDLARRLSPDVVVMDITMPGLSGTEATRQILAESPDTKVVALSVHSGQRFIEDMLGAGAAGYILKESAPEELVGAIRAAMRGEVHLSAYVTGVVVSEYVDARPQAGAARKPVQLTAKERDTLRLIVEGHSPDQIASALKTRAGTVKAIQRRLMAKLGVNTVEGLIACARADEGTR